VANIGNLTSARRISEYLKSQRRTLSTDTVADLGLRFGLMGYRPADIAGVLENVVYLELLRQGYQVSVGVLGNLEVDFVAEKGGELRYYQVCTTLEREDTVEREFRPLEQIPDQWPKTIVVYQPTPVLGRNGICVVSLLAFLRGAS